MQWNFHKVAHNDANLNLNMKYFLVPHSNINFYLDTLSFFSKSVFAKKHV